MKRTKVFVPPLALLAAVFFLSGCTTERLTEPPQTATEQLIVSSAVDHALANLKPPIPRGSKVFVDASYFDTDNVLLSKYTIGGVRDLVLRLGGDLADDRKDADFVLEMRNGGQSINHNTLLIGVPSIPVPIPLAGPIQTPEIALFKHDKQQGISKIALTLYGAKTGGLAASIGPIFGDSQYTHWTALLLINWDTQNILPDTIPEPAGIR